MKLDLKICLLFVLTFLTYCKSEDKLEGYKSSEIIIVTLDIETHEEIEIIKLFSSGGQDSILKREVDNKTTITLKSPQKGEGTFSICIYTIKNTWCSPESYVEGGYRPKLKFKSNKFEKIKSS